MSTIDKIFGYSLILLSLLAWALMGESPGAQPLRPVCLHLASPASGAECVTLTTKGPNGPEQGPMLSTSFGR